MRRVMVTKLKLDRKLLKIAEYEIYMLRYLDETAPR